MQVLLQLLGVLFLGVSDWEVEGMILEGYRIEKLGVHVYKMNKMMSLRWKGDFN